MTAPMPPQRVLVLDSDGFVGTRVVRALAGVSWATAVVMPRARVLDVLRDPQVMAKTLAEADAVINCAGEAPTVIREVARSLYGAASRVQGKRIVHLGSMTVYGATAGTIDESAPLLPVSGAYAAAQLAADTLARKCPTAVVLRLGAEYGAGHGPLSETLARLLVAGRIGALGAAGDGPCNAVHVDDVAHAAVAALHLPGPAGRVYNLAATEDLTWNRYLALYAGALGVPLREIGPGRWQWERGSAPLRKLVQLAGRPLGIAPPPLVSPSLARMLALPLKLDGRRAEVELGIRYTPHAEGLAEAAAAYRRR